MRFLRIVTVYNEADIIRRNLEWYIDQGMEIVVLDEGSTDATYAICQEYLGCGIVRLEQRPVAENDPQRALATLWEICDGLDADVVIKADADEFFEAPDPGVGLAEGLAAEFAQGYNLIRFHNVEFWMTERDAPLESDPLRRIRHYSYFSSHLYRACVFHPGINYWEKLGHAPIFPPGMVPRCSPKVFISRHYKFRSLEQGYAKIDRIRPPTGKPTQSIHYLKYRKSPEWFIIPREYLTEYHEDRRWNLTRTYDGGRLNRRELIDYLGLESEDALDRWFASRTFNPGEVPA